VRVTPSVATDTPYDELVAADGAPRPAWEEIAVGLDRRSARDLARLRAQVDRLLDDDGVTYHPLPGGPGHDVPTADQVDQQLRWLLDPIPLVIDPDTWSSLERGLLQRSRLLDAVLSDLYGDQRVLHHELVDPEVVFGHAGYLRAAHGIRLPGSHQLFLHGVDVLRGPTGEFMAVGDRTEAPSGVGYAMADRRAVSRVLPEEYARTAPHGLGGFFRTVRRALEAVAPHGVDDPRIVLLSPGTFSETAFDQAFVAAQLGIPFVGSADLTVRRGRLWMRALGHLEPVDVVLRRVDAEWSDPLDLRPGSRLGIAGLREMCRRGSVSVVNTLGSGVLENPALRDALPLLSRELLGEDLLLPSVPTHWCGDPVRLSHVLAHLDSMVLLPLSGGRPVSGNRLTRAQQEVWRARLRANPGRWAGQDAVVASVAPAAGTDGVHGHPVGMRLFTVAQEGGYAAMRGALGRVVGEHGIEHPTLTAAKDVWVRARATTTVRARPDESVMELRPAMAPVTSPRALADLFWLGRYAERSEDITRLLLAVRARTDDFRFRPTADGAGCVPVLLGAVEALVPRITRDADDPIAQMRGLLLDVHRPGTVAHSLHGVHRAANAVRDQLSVETWMVLAGVDRAVAALAAEPVATAATMQYTHTAVLSGMLALSGLSTESMVRDAGWHMMDAGRRVERSQQLTSLLRTTLTTAWPDAVQTLVVESVLSVGESIITHRRRYGGRVRTESVCELLLLDPENPRSLHYQLERLGEDLKALPNASGTSRPERHLGDLVSTLRRCVPADLAKVAGDGRRTELADVLTELHEGLRELSDMIAAQHFWHQVEMRPLWGPVGREVAR